MRDIQYVNFSPPEQLDWDIRGCPSTATWTKEIHTKGRTPRDLIGMESSTLVGFKEASCAYHAGGGASYAGHRPFGICKFPVESATWCYCGPSCKEWSVILAIVVPLHCQDSGSLNMLARWSESEACFQASSYFPYFEIRPISIKLQLLQLGLASSTGGISSRGTKSGFHRCQSFLLKISLRPRLLWLCHQIYSAI